MMASKRIATVYYLHPGALESTRLVATASVTIKFSSNYVPYGSNHAASGRHVHVYRRAVLRHHRPYGNEGLHAI